MAAWPELEQVRAWAGVPEAEISDDQLSLVMAAEMDIQLAYCAIEDIEDPPEAIAQSLLRRCARAIAARGLPLGSLPAPMTGVGAEYGLASAARSMMLPRLDAEVERLESPYRITAIA